LQPAGFRQVRVLLTFFVENLVVNRSRFAGSCAC